MMNASLFVDAHVHIYPNFDLERAIRDSLQNFQRAAKDQTDAVKIWLLTERSDCHFFRDALTRRPHGFYFAATSEDEALQVRDRVTDEPLLYVIAGRQLISADRLEICALATLLERPDGTMGTADLVAAVHQAGGVAAINWAPGKWFGARGEIVRRLFSDFSQELFISDTTMRPTVWRTPKLMASAVRGGSRVLCGSDPLPFAGEERLIASYVCKLVGAFDRDRPAQSLKALFRQPGTTFTACGHRSGPFTFLRRQIKIMAEKRN